MNNLSKVLIFKIILTLLLWCLPLLFVPMSALETLGMSSNNNAMLMRLLGWAYLSLCVGYGFALKAALNGKRLMGPVWVGIVSNGGASLYLVYFGISGAWSAWAEPIQVVAWGSAVVTTMITLGLYVFGVKGKDPIVA